MTAFYHLNLQPTKPLALDAAAQLADRAWTFHQAFPPYRPARTCSLAALAADLGVGSLALRDESSRFGLNAFKGLGASFAMHHWLATYETPADAVFATATDGNHGRAVAWMARQLGMRSVVYLPDDAAPARIDAIQNEGAKVVLVAGGYDEAVRQVMVDAAHHGWIVIQDTATADYREVPEWIAAGYWTMARELETSLHVVPEPAVDLVILHAGVGTWPAAMVAYYWHRYGERRPRIVVIEPAAAACVLESVRAGQPVTASGSQQTMMAGLNCGFPSLTAFAMLAAGVDAFVAIPDRWAAAAMRRLAVPAGDDAPIVSGESGAASVAGLMALRQDPALQPVREHLALNRTTRVLVWSTEGATDVQNWERVVGRPLPA